MATSRVRLTRPAYGGSSLSTKGLDKPDPPPPSKEGERGGSLVGSDAATLLESKISDLTPTERLALAEKLLAANLGAVEQGRDVDMWATAITEAIAGVLKQRGIPAYAVMPVRKVVGAASAWASVKAFAASAGFEQMSVPARQSAYRLLADLLIRYASAFCQRTDAPFTLKLVGNLIPQLSNIFDREFPGYLDSGLASVPFRMRADPCAKLSPAQ